MSKNKLFLEFGVVQLSSILDFVKNGVSTVLMHFSQKSRGNFHHCVVATKHSSNTELHEENLFWTSTHACYLCSTNAIFMLRAIRLIFCWAGTSNEEGLQRRKFVLPRRF